MDSKIIDFSYSLTSELKIPFRIKLLSLQGLWPVVHLSEWLRDPFLRMKTAPTQPDSRISKDLYVSFQLFANNKPLCLPIKTQYKSLPDVQEWNQWIVFPISVSSLPIATQITITIWDFYSPRNQTPFAGTTFALFGKNEYV